jgi:hypothetical protein
VDKHLEVAEVLVDPKKTWSDKLRALPRIARFYVPWYAKQWLGWGAWPRWSSYGQLATHLRFADRASRRLARAIFHGMVMYQAGLEKKQAFLFRAVDIAMELFVITAAVCRAHRIEQTRRPESAAAIELADLGAFAARRRVQRLFADMWRNDDRERYRVGRALLDGRYRWLEEGAVPLSMSEEDLRPRAVEPRGAARSPRAPRRRQPRPHA